MILLGRYPSIKVKAEYSMFLKFKYNPTIVAKVKSLPIRYYIPDQKVWEVPITSVNRVVNLFGINNIKLFTEFPEVASYLEYSKKSGKRKTVKELKEYYSKLKCAIPGYKFKVKPLGHQIESFNIGLKQDNLFITDEMGLGKSFSALLIMDYKISIGKVNHVLIICGVNALKYNWVNEIEKFSYNTAHVIDGTKKQRLSEFSKSDQYHYTIINAEMLRNKDLFPIIKDMIDSSFFEGIIVDECHKLSNKKSITGKNFLSIDNAKYKLCLTGTPITKRIEKLWLLLKWMHITEDSYSAFTKRYCILGGFSGWDVVGYKNLNELHELLDQHQLRRSADILEIPKIYKNTYVEMNKSQIKEYKLIQEGIIADIENGDITTINPMTVSIKLRQYTDTLKIKAVLELVDELFENDQYVVIFGSYKESLYQLKDTIDEKYPGRVDIITGDINASERQVLVDKFQNSKIPRVMIGTIATLGTGYTLIKSRHVIYLNKDWIVANNEQAGDRCHRIGAKGTVILNTVLVKNSIDEHVEDVLENDQFYISQVTDGRVINYGNAKLLHKLLAM